MTDDWTADIDDEELVAKVQAFARHFIPDVVCELKDYRKRLGLGTLTRMGRFKKSFF